MLRVTFVSDALRVLDGLASERSADVYEWLFKAGEVEGLANGTPVAGYEPPAYLVEIPAARVALVVVPFQGRLHVVRIKELDS